jgi:hypothetical protein
MHAAVRPYATAGVVLVGASVIAVTPIESATPPDIRIANTAVQLTAVESAWAFYPLVVRATLENAGILAQRYLAEPFPIIQAILGNEVTSPSDILTALRWVGTSAISWPVAGALGALHSIWDIVSAVVTLNPIDLVNAVLNFPIRIVDAVLNGYPINLWQVDVEGLLGFTGSLIALDQAIGAAISDLLSPTSPSPSLAPVNEPPQRSAMTLTLTTSPAVNSGLKPEDAGLTMTGPDTSTLAQEGLDTAGTANATNGLSQAQSNALAQAQHGPDISAAGAANATDGLAQARSNTSTKGQHGLDTATSAINNASTDIRDDMVQPGQVGGNSAPSGGDAVKPAKPIGDQIGSTLSTTGNETKKADTRTGTRGSQVGGNGAPSGGDAVKPAKPIGNQIGSTLSTTGNETKKAETSTGTRGSQG